MEIDRKKLEQDIREIICSATEVEPAELTLTAHLIKELGVDSLKLIEITVALERKYQIKLREEELPQMLTLDQAINQVEKILKAKQ